MYVPFIGLKMFSKCSFQHFFLIIVRLMFSKGNCDKNIRFSDVIYSILLVKVLAVDRLKNFVHNI